MARGYPDFFGFSVFPQYGPFQVQVAAGVNCPNGATTQVITIAGKGATYGGYLHLSIAQLVKNQMSVDLDLDGNVFTQDIPGPGVIYYNDRQFMRFLRLFEYSWDGATSIAAYEIAKDFTFGVNLTISVTNNNGIALTAQSNIWWAQVV